MGVTLYYGQIIICIVQVWILFDQITLFFPGVVRQVKPLIGPVSTVLKLAMNYVTNGVVANRNIINVHIFVSEFWF